MQTIITVLISLLVVFYPFQKAEVTNKWETNQSNGDQNWDALQDSLRGILLKSKPNQALKPSILEELYLRGLVQQESESFKFTLPFDLHGFDCGAPDCYSTDMTFEIAANNPVLFPEEIRFKMHEHGCVNPETSMAGTFEIEEQTREFINYYSKSQGSNLLIFRKDSRQEYVYYFPLTKKDSTKGDMIDKLLKNFNEEDQNVVAPYRISSMTTREYQGFLEQ